MTDPGPARIGIVLPDAATPVLVRRALESIASQSFRDWHLVIVETTNASESLAEALPDPTDPRITLLPSEENEVAAAAINRGLAALETELAIIHAERDSWAPDFLHVMARTFDRMNAALPGLKGAVSGVASVEETVTGNHVRIDSVRDWLPPGLRDDLRDGVFDIRRSIAANPFPAIAFLFDRQAAIDVALYDTTLPALAEWDFHQRFCLENDVWVHTERLAFHRCATDRTDPSESAAFRALLTNRWIRREGATGLGTLQVLQALAAQGTPESSAGGMDSDVALPSQKKTRGPVGDALSRFNRLRKRWV